MAAFKKLDKNGDGFISCIEFRVALAQRPVYIAPSPPHTHTHTLEYLKNYSRTALMR